MEVLRIISNSVLNIVEEEPGVNSDLAFNREILEAKNEGEKLC